MNRLAGAALVASAPWFAFALLLRHIHIAIGMIAGVAICLTLYWLLHALVTRGMDMIVGGLRGRELVAHAGAAKAQFGMIMVGKFILLTALLWIALGMLKVSLLGFGLGFAVSQIAITVVAIKQLSVMSILQSQGRNNG